MKNKKILILPPGIDRTDDLAHVSNMEFSDVFVTDIFRQKIFVTTVFGSRIPVSGYKDIDPGNVFDDINRYARHFARGWFKDTGVNDLFEFDGVNLAGQFVIAFSYYFVKVLKALKGSIAVLEKYPDHEYVMIDDGSVWTRIFKYTLSLSGKSCEYVHTGLPGTDIPVDIRQITSGKMRYGGIISGMNKMMSYGTAKGGILFSCALRFAEPLWDSFDRDIPLYYLRPELSLKAYKKILSNRSVKYFIPEQFIKSSDKKICRTRLEERDIISELDKSFSPGGFFMYEGINIWDIVKEDIFFMIRDSLVDGAMRVTAFNRLLEKLSPGAVIVEEDTCPFNRILIECANRRNIPTIQLLHGLLTNELMSSMITSSKIAVPGEYSRHKLLEWGVSDDKILITGAPQYSPSIGHVSAENKEKNRAVPGYEKDRISLTFISNPSFDEREPYFVGNPLTYESMEKKIRIIAETIKSDRRVYCTIKVHPMDDDTAFIEKIVNDLGISENAEVVKDCDILNLIMNSDLVMCGGSTSYLEALLLKRPVLIFDELDNMFWKDLKSEYLDLNDIKGSAIKVCNILKNTDEVIKRLRAQEKEIEWHFRGKNINASQNFTNIVWNMMKIQGKIC